MTNTAAFAPAPSAVWTRVASLDVGDVVDGRGSLLAKPEPLGGGLSRYLFVLGPVVLPLDADVPVLRF